MVEDHAPLLEAHGDGKAPHTPHRVNWAQPAARRTCMGVETQRRRGREGAGALT